MYYVILYILYSVGCKVQLSAGLEEISITDYPAEWQSLLPEMVQHLKTNQELINMSKEERHAYI